jgi:hypothetical protein
LPQEERIRVRQIVRNRSFFMGPPWKELKIGDFRFKILDFERQTADRLGSRSVGRGQSAI